MLLIYINQLLNIDQLLVLKIEDYTKSTMVQNIVIFPNNQFFSLENYIMHYSHTFLIFGMYHLTANILN